MSIDMEILIVERIKDLMMTERLSQYALAKSINVSQSTICNWLNGKKEPSVESLWKLADFLTFPSTTLSEERIFKTI